MKLIFGRTPTLSPPHKANRLKYRNLWAALRQTDDWVAVSLAEVEGNSSKAKGHALRIAAKKAGLDVSIMTQDDLLFLRIRPVVPEEVGLDEFALEEDAASDLIEEDSVAADARPTPAPYTAPLVSTTTPQHRHTIAVPPLVISPIRIPPTPTQATQLRGASSGAMRARRGELGLAIETMLDRLLAANDPTGSAYAPDEYEVIDLGSDATNYASYMSEVRITAKERCGPAWKVDLDRDGSSLYCRLLQPTAK